MEEEIHKEQLLVRERSCNKRKAHWLDLYCSKMEL